MSIKVFDKKGQLDTLLTTNDDLIIEIEYEVKEVIKDLRVALNLITSEGTNIFSSSDFNFQEASRLRTPGRYKSICHVPGNLLNAGIYIANIDFDIPVTRAIILGIPVSFTISELMFNQMGITKASKPYGVIHPFLNWEVKNI